MFPLTYVIMCAGCGKDFDHPYDELETSMCPTCEKAMVEQQVSWNETANKEQP